MRLLETTVAAVWERNLERFDPGVAGDTATSLGITAAENLRELLIREWSSGRTAGGVEVSAPRQSLVVRAGGVDIHVMKAPDPGLGVDAVVAPQWGATRWVAASDVRRGAALENARRYEPAAADQRGQAILPGLGPATSDPARLRHLVLVWAGHPVSAVTSAWLAVPFDAADRPWLAARPLWSHGPREVPRPLDPPVVALPFARPPLEVALTPRPTRSPP